MENNKKLHAGAIIGIIVLTVLSAAALVSYIISSFTYFSGIHIFIDFIPVTVLFLAVAYYAAFGYKKPHGDLLRFVFLLFSVRNFAAILRDVLALEQGLPDASSTSFTLWGIAFRGVSVILTAYIAGRLNKVKSNAVLLTIVLASHLVNTILWYYQLFQFEYSFIDILYNSASLIFCIDLIVAYAFRYRSHKEVGLADKN